MSKWVKRILSVTLVCLLVGGGLTTGAMKASAAPSDDFDLYQYRANILAKPEAEGGVPFIQNLLNYYRDSNYQSSSRIWVECLQDEPKFMGGLVLWKAYTIDVGNAVEVLMDEKGFYETALFAILKTKMESPEFVSTVLGNTMKNSISLLKQMEKDLAFIDPDGFKYDLNDPAVALLAKNTTENLWHNATGETLGVLSDIIGYASDAVDYFERASSYMAMVNLNEEIKACVNDLYERSSGYSIHLRNALYEMKTVCQGDAGAWAVAVAEAGFSLGSTVFSKLTGDLIEGIIKKAHPAAAAVLIGRDAGQAICNLLFGTDNISNQFRAMQALVEIESLMRSSLSRLESSYNAQNTTPAAQTYLSAVDLLFSTYFISNDYGKKFVNVAFGKGLNYWLGGSEIQSEMEALYESRQENLIKAHKQITSWWVTKLQIDYPELYEKMSPPSNIPLQAIAPRQENLTLRVGDTVIIGYDLVPSNTTDSVFIASQSENSAILKPDWSVDALLGYRAVAVGTTRVRIHTSEYLHGIDPNIEAFVNVTVIPNDSTPTNPVSEYTYTVQNGQATITGYIGSGEVLNIPWAIDQYPVVAIGNNAFQNKASIRRVVIPSGVTIIRQNAFRNCTSLSSITLGNSVSTIVDNAFTGCTSLFSISIPNSVTSIGDGAFSGCTSLTGIVLPNNLTWIRESVFQGCTSLNQVIMSNKITDIKSNAFEGCISLARITIPNNPENRMFISSNAFTNCTSLTDLTIESHTIQIDSSAFDNCPIKSLTINMTSIPDTSFANRPALENLTIGDNSNWISMNAFSGCTSLKNLTIGSGLRSSYATGFHENHFADSPIESLSIDMDRIPAEGFKDVSTLKNLTIGNNVISIYSDAFSGTSLASVSIGNNMTSIGSNAFFGCAPLTSIIIPNSVTSIGNSAFRGTSLSNVTIGNSVTSIGYSAFSETPLTSIVIPNSVITIGGSAFYRTPLSSVTIGNSVTTIGSSAFADCSLLESIVIPDSVITIESSVFRNCTSLKNITIPEGVQAISGTAFDGCTSLASLAIPDSVTSFSSGIYATLYGCTSLKDIAIGSGLASFSISDLSSTAVENLTINAKSIIFGSHESIRITTLKHVTVGDNTTSIDSGAFQNCTSLSNVVLGNNVTAIGGSAFRGCTSLKSINIPDNVITIDMAAFEDCTSLTKIELPDGVTTIGNYAFYRCSSLESINIPNGVTSIGYQAFSCTSLETVSIPDSVTSLGEGAFAYCSSLKTATVGNNVASIAKYAFEWCTSLTDLTIGNRVTSIGDWSIYHCSLLTNVVIPNSVTSIGRGAFNYSSSMTSVTIPRSVVEIESDAFPGSQLTIYCYKNSQAHMYAMKRGISFVLLDGEGDISKVALNARVEKIGQTQKGGNTSESWAAFQNALGAAQTVLNNASATQTEINNAFAALEAAYAGLSEHSSPTSYNVTVNNGMGAGNFVVGATVNITANTAPIGKVFDKWTTSDGVIFANASATTTTFTMPAKNISVTATYKDSSSSPSPPDKGIFGTNPKWYGAWWHYLLFFIGFGFIWMWF